MGVARGKPEAVIGHQGGLGRCRTGLAVGDVARRCRSHCSPGAVRCRPPGNGSIADPAWVRRPSPWRHEVPGSPTVGMAEPEGG